MGMLAPLGLKAVLAGVFPTRTKPQKRSEKTAPLSLSKKYKDFSSRGLCTARTFFGYAEKCADKSVFAPAKLGQKMAFESPLRGQTIVFRKTETPSIQSCSELLFPRSLPLRGKCYIKGKCQKGGSDKAVFRPAQLSRPVSAAALRNLPPFGKGMGLSVFGENCGYCRALVFLAFEGDFAVVVQHGVLYD